MALPFCTRVCCCIPLKTGCIILTAISIVACICNISAGAWNLPRHRERLPEDNLISMGMVMFSTLSLVSNIVILFSIFVKRPGYMQFAMLFNSLFIVFSFLVGIVTCLFSPEFKHFVKSAKEIAFAIIALVAGAGYCIYYILIVNSMYRQMKMETYSGSPVPV